MVEVKTDLIVEAKPKGFAQVTNEASRLSKAGVDAVQKQARGFEKLEKTIGGVEKAIQGLEKSMQSMGSRMEQMVQKTGRTLRDSQRQMQSQGAFSQGLIQGALPGVQMLQRGPGMGRQTAGMAIGGTARGVAGGLLRAPATGVGGIAQAAQALPGGELLSGQIQAVSGFAQQALGFQRQRMSAMPFLTGGGGRILGQMSAARRAAMEGVARPSGMMGQADIDSAVQEARERARGGVSMTPELQAEATQMAGALESRKRINRRRELGGSRGADMIARSEAERLRDRFGEVAQQSVLDRERQRAGAEAAQKMREQLNAPRRQFEENRQKAGSAAAAGAAQSAFGGIRTAGQELLGVGKAQAMQQAAAITGAGGGGTEAMRRQGMLGTGFAAQTLFGASAGASGAFLQAGRRGGIAGAQVGAAGEGGRQMTDAIGDAMRLGLEGSEITQYLETMSQGIQQWQQTGIPVAKDAISGIGQEMGRLGLGGVRGTAVARGMVGAAQQVSRGGPQSAGQLMLMRELGGFEPGKGGASAFEEAQIQLEQLKEGKVGGKNARRLFERMISAGGGGAQGRVFARKQLGQMGINLGAEEMKRVGTMLEGGAPDEDLARMLSTQQGRRDRGAAAAPKSPEAMQRRATELMDKFGSGLQTQASQQSQMIDIGKDMIPFMQQLQGASKNIAEGFTELAGTPLTKLSEAIEDLTKKLSGKDGLTGVVDSMWDSWSDFVAP